MRSKHNSKRIRTLRRRRLALALVTAMAAPMAMAQNLPDSGSVTSGAASIVGTGNQMTITQTGIEKGTIIDWGSFNIGVGYGVTFNQLGADSVTLNRVIGYGNGPGMSLIDGTLTSNGNVFIINPAGIVFGSGAQVNVGGLVASTLNIDNGDFLAGVASGQYRFTASGSVAGGVWNNGQLTAASGGTIGLIGSQINNAGTITANNGSVVFGATSQVTLDYFGDGLTQVTVSGNGLGVSNCQTNSCNGGITSSGNVFAEGGHIEMRTNTMDGAPAGSGLFVDPASGGRIWIGGNVAARTSGTRRGSVVIDAGMGNIDLGGVQGRTGNVSANGINAGEQAGTIQLRGNQLFTHLCVWTAGTCQNNNQLGLINATSYGNGGLAGGTINVDVARFYHAGVMQASSATGAGGVININANSAEIYNLIFAEGNGGGAGGTININANNLLLHRGETPWLGGPGINYSLATLSAYGSSSGGTVNLDVGSLSMVDLGNVSPDDVNLDPLYRPTINVNGYDGNGGSINVTTTNFSLSPWQYFEATGTQAGGNIAITADSINLAGGLVATGATGGIVTTTTTGSLFAADTAYIKAGTWLVHAPSVHIIPGSGATPGAGAVLTDDALSATLDGGTMVQLYADATMVSGATGSIQIGDGVNIVHSTGDAAGLELRATAGIYGSEFNIESTGGPLELTFTANANGNNPTEGYVSFTTATLTSNGGDIAMSGDGSGVFLEYSQVSSGSGDITISGNGDDNGIQLLETDLSSTSGDITVNGSAALGAGVSFYGAGNSITTTSGAISVASTGLFGLNVADVPFSTDTGDITLEGHSLGSSIGLRLADGVLVSNGGNITLIGSSVDSTGLFVNGADIASGGGDITLIGISTNRAGAQVSGSDVDSAGGNLTIRGESLSSTGLIVSGANISGGAGDINLSGMGVGFGPGVSIGQESSISTTSGDVYIDGTSSTYIGVLLNVGDVTTTTGNIGITGTGGAVGVRLSSGGLTTTSGDIYIAGMGGSDAGLRFDAASSVDAGSGVVALATSNDGSYDAIILQGSIASKTGVNLRPLNETDTILLGAGNGFSLISADLARIDAPLLVIGSAQHKGAIRVTEAVDWDDDLTLQNAGGAGGIDIQADVDVGDNTLALASGGNISQASAGGITAHSLLAIAGGDVTLTAAQNNVAASSIAGSAGGDFTYQDMDDLAIGEVSSFGFSSVDNAGFVSMSATGIAAGDSVLVRTATGNLTLGADVSGSSIDLVAAGLFFNPVGASLTASNGWRIYASTPDGEERGGLQGDGPFDVFGCSFGDQGCLFLGEGNQFIYKEPRLQLAPIAPEAIAEWLDEDDLDGTATDLLITELCPVADTGDLLQSATGKDELAQEWMKTRRRLQLSNCIDNQNVPGCRF